jgi:hypothetical protein
MLGCISGNILNAHGRSMLPKYDAESMALGFTLDKGGGKKICWLIGWILLIEGTIRLVVCHPQVVKISSSIFSHVKVSIVA